MITKADAEIKRWEIIKPGPNGSRGEKIATYEGWAKPERGWRLNLFKLKSTKHSAKPATGVEVDHLLHFVQEGSALAAIANALKKEVSHIVRKDFVDKNGAINCVVSNMRYIEFGDRHHIRINDKTFTEDRKSASGRLLECNESSIQR